MHLPSFEPLLLKPCNVYAPFLINYFYPMVHRTSTATVFVVSNSTILQLKSFVGFGSKDHRQPTEGVIFRLSKSSSNGIAHSCCCLKQHHEITTTTKNSLTFLSPTEYPSRASPYSISIIKHCHDWCSAPKIHRPSQYLLSYHSIASRTAANSYSASIEKCHQGDTSLNISYPAAKSVLATSTTSTP